MRIPFTLVFLSVLPALCQEANTPSPRENQPSVQQSDSEQNKSALGVTPGEKTIKNKDLFDRTGYLHPFGRMARFVGEDQKAIWTSPFRSSAGDAKYWAIFGGATGLLIPFDEKIQNNTPHPRWLVNVGTNGSYLGTAYTLIPLTAGFYFIGTKWRDDRLREAGLMSFEALIDATIVDEVFKVSLARQRPLEGTGEGQFFHSSNRINASFPSGHAINTFALASVFAHEYHDKLWVKVLVYSYAGIVAGSRLAAERHFPSDTLVGGAMGWFIGDYIYAKRHNSGIEQNSPLALKILRHVSLSFGY